MRAGGQRARAERSTVKIGVRRIAFSQRVDSSIHAKGNLMNSIVYIVGAVVIIVAILGFLGLR